MTRENQSVSSDRPSRVCLVEGRSGNNTFRKDSRILKRSEFVRLSKINRKVHSRYFMALYDQGLNEKTRLGITVTKRVGNAVVRNRLKRYTREFFRQHRQIVESGIDVNIIIKKEASGIPSREAYLSLQSIFNRIRN